MRILYSFLLLPWLVLPAAGRFDHDTEQAGGSNGGRPIPLGARTLPAGTRTERMNELKQIGLAFNQFCDDYKGANRTKENFLNFIRTFGPIHEAVKTGYYEMNMKAKLTAKDIIAYEKGKDAKGYLCVKGDGSVDFVPEPEWKAALGIK